MAWTPTTAEMELIIEHGVAKIPAVKTAEALGVSIEDLLAFTCQLAIGRVLKINAPLRDDEEERPRIPSGFPTVNK